MYMEKHLVLILCALLLSTFLTGQIRGRLSLSEDQKTYEFYVTPNFSQVPPLSTTNSAQISIVAPTGGLEITNFESITGNWNGSDVSIITDPIENPGFSYVSIPLGSPMQAIVYEENVEILMFTFENGVECLGTLDIVDNAEDPFLPPNSRSVNIGNLFTILTFGPTNVYDGTDICCASCPGEEEEDPMEEEGEEEENEDAMEEEEETEDPMEEEEMEEETEDATPPTGQGTLCNRDIVSRIEIRLSAPGTPPYKAFWTNTTSGISDSMDIAIIDGPYTLIDNADPGIYEIRLIDNVGRTLNLVEEVQDGGTYFLNPQLKTTDVPCGSTTSGRIAVTFPEDATGTYSYEWSNGMTNVSEIEGLSPDTYLVTVTDNNGCTNIQQAIVGIEGGINADIALRNVSCLGSNDGEIAVNIANPEDFIYQWEGNGITNTSSTIADLAPGTYSVTISEPSGLCDQVKTVTVNEPEELTLSARITGVESCEDAAEGTITIDNISNAQGTIQYALDGENFSTTNRFTVPTGESYTITAIDEMGCTTSTTVDLPTSSSLSLEAPENPILELGDEMELEVLYNATSDVSFKWAENESLSCTDCPNPIINPTQTTTYTLILSDDNGCSKEATIIVFIAKSDKIYTPTAFSPNNDGINDHFNIFTGINVDKVNSLQIFNRWGERVFQSTEGYVPNVTESGWDGTFNGKVMTSDVYVYFADVTFKDGSSEIIKGELNLMK